jgi:hypothetical protein
MLKVYNLVLITRSITCILQLYLPFLPLALAFLSPTNLNAITLPLYSYIIIFIIKSISYLTLN